MLIPLAVHNGISVNMLKVGSKRRRTANEVETDRRESKMKDSDLQEKLAQLKSFEAQLA